MALSNTEERHIPDSNYVNVYFTYTFLAHADLARIHQTVDNIMSTLTLESEILKDRIDISVRGIKYNINYSYFLKWADLNSRGIRTPYELRMALHNRFCSSTVGFPDALRMQTQLVDDYHHFCMEDWAKV